MINYIKGDATNPQGLKPWLIVHICNNKGGWGKGFSGALSKIWPSAESEYRKWHSGGDNFRLGEVQFVYPKDSIIIANMLAQDGYKSEHNPTPVSYTDLISCLMKISKKYKYHNIHMPKIGCGLGGGDWNVIQKAINLILVNKGISVTVYEYP